MPKLQVPVEWKGKTFHVDLTNGHCLAIPLDHTHPQPNAFFAPLYEAAPHKAGDWIGDTREGALGQFFQSAGSILMVMVRIQNVWVISRRSDIQFMKPWEMVFGLRN